MKKQKTILTKHVLIDMGIEKLKRLGFDYVSTENILTDDVYKWYFVHMLKNMLGENEKADIAINQLLNDMK